MTLRAPLNGATLLASYPKKVFGSASVVVMVKWREGEYVTAIASSVDSPEWYWGNYFPTEEEALADFNRRAGLVSTP